MKKLSVLAFALIMTVSSNVFAEPLAVPALQEAATVNGTSYAAGTKGVKVIKGYTYPHNVTINGKLYPKGTRFDVIQMTDGALVPTHVNAAAAGGTATGGAATAAGTTGGTVGGLSTASVTIGAGVAGGMVALAGSTTTTHH